MANGPEEINENLNEANSTAASLDQKLLDILTNANNIADQAATIARNIGLGSIQAASFRKAFKDTADISRNLVDNADLIFRGQVKSRDIQKEIDKNTRSEVALKRQIPFLLNKIASESFNITNEEKQQIKNAKTQKDLRDLQLRFGRSLTEESRQALELLNSQITSNKQNAQELNKQLIFVKQIEERVGVTGKSLQALSKIPFVGPFIDSNKALKEMTIAAAEVDAQGKFVNNRFQIFSKGIKSIADDIKVGLRDPLIGIFAILNAGFKFDQQVTELERNLGLSRDNAEQLRERAEKIASSTNNISINTLDTVKAINTLNQEFGAASDTLRDDIVAETAKLIKLTNMSAQSASNFARFANMSGENMTKITQQARRAVVEAESEKGLRLDINKVLDEAGKITGQIAAQLGGNVIEISKAVAVARQFGMTLNQVAASGAALLNFEQSIGNELEAELLIGKQINLERARLAALTGDYETLTKEINKNVGDFGDFTKMNVIQQQALAASVGMTADQLSDVLLKNENIEALAQEARRMGDEDLAKQLEKRSVQEKFNDTIDKLKTLFTDIMSGPVMGIISGLGKTLSIFGEFLGMLGLGKGGFSDIVAQVVIFSKILFGTLNPLKAAQSLYLGIKGLVMGIKSGTIAINAAESIGLIKKGQANILRNKEVALQTIGNSKSAARNLYEGQTLGLMIKRNVQGAIETTRQKVSNVLEGTKIGLLFKGNILKGIGNTLSRIGNAIGLVGLLRTAGQFVMGMFSAGTKAPFPVNVVLPFILGAIAGGIAASLIGKYKGQGDDVYSGPQGSSGYGKRMLLAPEGAFSLNNRDTIIAGTDLFKANDMAMGPTDSINVNGILASSRANQTSNREVVEKLDALNNNVTVQTETINNKPVAQNTMIDPTKILNPSLPFENSKGFVNFT